MLKRMHSLEISGEEFSKKKVAELDPTGEILKCCCSAVRYKRKPNIRHIYVCVCACDLSHDHNVS